MRERQKTSSRIGNRVGLSVHRRKIVSIMLAAMMATMGFFIVISENVHAEEFVEPVAVPWTSGFMPEDSAWNSNGTASIVVGNDTSGLQPSAWYYNEPTNAWSPIYEGSDINEQPANTVTNENTSMVYSSIQDAVDNASAGNILRVYAGTYLENVVVNKRLVLEGNGSANTIIDASGTGIGVNIKADYCQLRNFTVTNAPVAGVHLQNVQNSVIRNNRILGNGDGIQLNGSSNNVIRDNDIESNALGMNVKWSNPEKTLIGPVAYGGASSGVMFESSVDGSEYDIIHHFKPGYTDGFVPYYTKPVTDGTYLYSTTYSGGAYDRGTIFRTDFSGGSYALLHEFNYANGRNPMGPLAIDGSMLYGMTLYGGEHDCGVVFKMQTDGSDYNILHSFEGGTLDGMYPYGGITVVGTELFGMTRDGGAHTNGTIFRMNMDGTGYSVVHHFDTDGKSPYGTLLENGGMLYGLASSGGSSGFGTAFAIDAANPSDGLNWSYNFTSSTGPVRPYGSLMYYNNVLYGMSMDGGTLKRGTIFNITPDGTSMKVLHLFSGGSGGQNPYGDLVTDGNYLYGMTEYGGSSNYGTVFRILPDGSNHNVTKEFNGTNGHSPYGSLLLNGGNLYGMTSSGGVHARGVVFEMATDGSFYKLIHEFGPYERTEGSDPYCGISTDGNYIYGTTTYGGTANYGQVYRMNMDGTGYTSLHDFLGSPDDGTDSWDAPLVYGGKLYGTTVGGGLNSDGTIYSMNPDGSQYQVIGNFSSLTTGRAPYNGVITDGLGHLYGMARMGGSAGWGMIYQFDLSTKTFPWVHEFTGGSSGGGPWGELLLSGTTLYGMTYTEGDFSNGIVFKIQTDSTGFTPIHQFNVTIDGGYPYGTMVQDSTHLYGITNQGGGGDANDCGTIFKIEKSTDTFSVIHKLITSEGAYSRGSLTMDGDMLYAMTEYGSPSGRGTIIETNKNSGVTRVIHEFQGYPTDGEYPYYNDLIVQTYPADASSGNEIFNNNFLSNTWQAEDNAGPNVWSKWSPSYGNFWDNYTDIDADNNGIWDSPFIISGNASEKDDNPWMRRDGWSMPYTTFKSVAYDPVYERFWIVGEASADAQSQVYFINKNDPGTMIPVDGPGYGFSAVAVDSLGNIMVAGNDLQYFYYYDVSTGQGYDLVENTAGSMYGWNITGITFNTGDNRFYLVGNVENQDTGVAFYTDPLPLNSSGKKCYIDNSDFMNFPGIGGLREISWNPTRNYSLAVGDGVYKVHTYSGSGQKLDWSVIKGAEAGKAYYDIDWDTDGWNEAGIVGQSGGLGTYWRYYHTNPQLIDGNTSSVSSVFPTCAMKPPSSPKWLLVSYSEGGTKFNIQAKDESGDISMGFETPNIFAIDMWKQSDSTRASVLNTQLDAGSVYTFFIEGNYTYGGTDEWDTAYINLTGWYDNGNIGNNSSPLDSTWSLDTYRTRQFKLTYHNGSAAMVYPAPVGTVSEFYVESLWLDPNTYDLDNSHHRLYINVSMGAQTYVAASDFSNGGATNRYDANKALNDAGTWDFSVNMTADGMFNETLEEFGIKKTATIMTTGSPSGSAPPGTVNYSLSTPTEIYYSSNSDYFVNVSIPHLYKDGNLGDANYISATDVSVQSNHSLAISGTNTDIDSRTGFPGEKSPLCVWGTSSGAAIAAALNGTQSAGPEYTNYVAESNGMAFETTYVYWWASVPAGLPDGTYRATITITVWN